MQTAMNYSQAEKFLIGLTDYEKSSSVLYNAGNYDLRRMELLLGSIANPHRGRRTVHITGTKGKGSTAAMISGVLSAAKYRTGLFTSPHLHSWRERIALNGTPITKKDFAGIADSLELLVRSINSEARFGKLTTFEVITAMAFLYFEMKNAAYQVIEVGMGGRLDATNVLYPDVCVITSISLDHTQILGETLEQIAAEKAGIIKRGCTVISAPQERQVAAVIERKCRELKAPLIMVGKDIKWRRTGGSPDGQNFKLSGMAGNYDLGIPLLGEYQLENAALAVSALKILVKNGAAIEYADIVRGLRNVKWPARFQILKNSPLVIADGAHNPYSLTQVIRSIGKFFSYKKAAVVFGSSADKDIRGMAQVLAGFVHRIILTQAHHPRAATTDNLERIFKAAGVPVIKEPDPEKAIAGALAEADKEDLILITGSLFLAAGAAEILLKKGRPI
ncbi:MAG: bifunctional folylpolyglutamate synthase/dihydrofolate synthase [Dehalococcoidia bacterium]|nr:bifunctional folylpolyglutamate synthase/dihydrofolate synthase [Dehalococcoidia bacterium]MDD5493658.1 bifunctional folylpolyglutamate synthase/dihydrofolate synthase [Dehalococcoidia bacterium]